VEHVKIHGDHTKKCRRLHVELGRVDSDMRVDARILPLQVSTGGEHALIEVEYPCPRFLVRSHDLPGLIDLPLDLLQQSRCANLPENDRFLLDAQLFVVEAQTGG
jgi:hypothetical protein